MVGEIEMDSFYGTCKFCGQMKMVDAADEEDANVKVTNSCTLPRCQTDEKKKTDQDFNYTDMWRRGGKTRV